MSNAERITVRELGQKLGWPVWKVRKWAWKADLKPVEFRQVDSVTPKGLRRYLVSYYDSSVIAKLKAVFDKSRTANEKA